MVPIHPASVMPMTDPTIAHKRVASRRQAIDAKHPVLDWKITTHSGTVDMATCLLAPSHDRRSSRGIDSFGKYSDSAEGSFQRLRERPRRHLDRASF